MKIDRYDVCVVGGGAAGLTAAKMAHGMGQRTILLEKDKLGDECTLTGCVPSKTVIKSAEVGHYLQKFEQFGWRASCTQRNADGVMLHAQDVIQDVYAGHTPDDLRELGIDVLLGDTQFIDSTTIRSGDTKIRAKRYIICTCSHSFIPH